MANPFENVSFDETPQGVSPMESGSVSSDDLTSVLLSTVRPINSPFLPKVDSSAGVDRVNANTGNTGVIGYKDSKGQAVLTNVAKDPLTGQDKKLPVLLQPSPNGTSYSQVDKDNLPTQKADISSAVQGAIATISKAKTYEEGLGIYRNLVESIATQKAGLETQATTFAENKLGIPVLMDQLNQARQADKADPQWYPGIGDSPITQKITEELRLTRGMVTKEAADYLSNNPTYNGLQNHLKIGELSLNNLGSIISKERQVDLARESANINRTAAQQDRTEDRAAKKEENLIQIYDNLSPRQIAAIETLNRDKLEGLDPTSNVRKMSLAGLAIGNKDKAYQAAITAEGPQQLLSLSLQGNKWANTLLMEQEGNAIGTPPAQIRMQMQQLNEILRDPNLALKVLSSRPGADPKAAKTAAANHNADLNSTDKKGEATAARVGYAIEWMTRERTKAFATNVNTWESTDPLMKTAIAEASKTTGKPSMENVLAAYLGDSAGKERISKANDFKNHLHNAALKYKDSAFGMPSVDQLNAQINQAVGTWFTQFLKSKVVPGLEKASTAAGIATGGAGQLFVENAIPKAFNWLTQPDIEE